MCPKPGRSCLKKMLHFIISFFKHSLIFVGKYFLLLSFGKLQLRGMVVFIVFVFFQEYMFLWGSGRESQGLVSFGAPSQNFPGTVWGVFVSLLMFCWWRPRIIFYWYVYMSPSTCSFELKFNIIKINVLHGINCAICN